MFSGTATRAVKTTRYGPEIHCIHEMWLNLLYYRIWIQDVFWLGPYHRRTCFGWGRWDHTTGARVLVGTVGTRHQRCWEQNTSQIQMLRHFNKQFLLDWLSPGLHTQRRSSRAASAVNFEICRRKEEDTTLLHILHQLSTFNTIIRERSERSGAKGTTAERQGFLICSGVPHPRRGFPGPEIATVCT